jgi:uncharacterized protein YndB with AHSA1/START domain
MDKAPLNGRSIEKEIVINTSTERVFQALTEKGELERWFARKVEVDLRPGGAISLEWDRAAGVFERGTILVLEPTHRLSHTWEAMSQSPTTVTFTVTAAREGTRLRLVHSGIGEGPDWDNYYTALNSGWNKHLKNLTDWLETGSCATPGPTGTLTQSIDA